MTVPPVATRSRESEGAGRLADGGDAAVDGVVQRGQWRSASSAEENADVGVMQQRRGAGAACVRIVGRQSGGAYAMQGDAETLEVTSAGNGGAQCVEAGGQVWCVTQARAERAREAGEQGEEPFLIKNSLTKDFHEVLPITAAALLKARGAGGVGFAILGIFDLNLPWGQNCRNSPLPVSALRWGAAHPLAVCARSTCFGTRAALVFSARFRPWNSLSGTANPFAHPYRISGSALGPAAGSKRLHATTNSFACPYRISTAALGPVAGSTCLQGMFGTGPAPLFSCASAHAIPHRYY
ncbi:hypothetical protein B0H19DRAFT_1230199 [Mycena capillaripes]|nr:hypothetical protein B0H19DRAFT_1230199 [Mycena capillaripes]